MLQNKSKCEFRDRLRIFLNNLLEMAKDVLKCVFNKDYNYIPTKLGITPLMYYVSVD